MKHTYEYICELFQKSGCKLLETEENWIYITAKSNVRFLAQCKHENQVILTNFIQKQTGKLCKKCVKNVVRNKLSQYIDGNKGNTTSVSFNQEYIGYLKIKNYLDPDYKVVKTNEGCLADFLIKPKNSNEDKWLMIQLKTTQKPCNDLYSFSIKHSRYYNCVIVLYCIQDNKIWVIQNSDIQSKRNLNIGLTQKSKYYKFQTSSEFLNKLLINYYHTYMLVTNEQGITPQQKYHKREIEYFQLRERLFPYLDIEYPEEDGTVYDLKINGLRVQDKVCSPTKNKQSYALVFHHNAGSKDGVKQYQSYQCGENHFYWIWIDKNSFYIFPEAVLIKQGYISNTNKKRYTILLYPRNNDIAKDKFKTSWANEFLHNAKTITEKTFQDLGLK